MTIGIGVVDAIGFGVELPERVDCLADGGQLVRSSTGEIFGVENQESALLAELF